VEINSWRVRFADGTLTESQTASGLLHKIAAQHWSYSNQLTDKENILLRLHETSGGWIDPELDDYDFLKLLSDADLLMVSAPTVY
jgi:hypothetical protein